MKKIIISLLVSFSIVALVFWARTYFLTWENTDTLNGSSGNDTWTISWSLNITDSLSSSYASWERWRISWEIISELYWVFNIKNSVLKLTTSSKTIPSECWTSYEVYDIEWELNSSLWWDVSINSSNSFFCSNQYAYFLLDLDNIWQKEIWDSLQTTFTDDFDKQQISISWTAKLKNASPEIDSRWQNDISILHSSFNVAKFKASIYKNMNELTRSISPITVISTINNFVWDWSKEKTYFYDYKNMDKNINFDGSTYLNNWDYVSIWWWSDVPVTWINNLVVKNANVYIRNNIYNTNDDNSLLIILVTRDKETWKWGNIYIDPDVTNIDAVLISEWSLISFDGTDILHIWYSGHKNTIRKQLMIYGSIFSSNTVWSDEIPYWADHYENYSSYPTNEMQDSIYDLANLRTFNLDYWIVWSSCDNTNKLAPIDWSWDFELKAWAWWKNCYIDDSKSKTYLRDSDKTNPVIVDYNPSIQKLSAKLLKTD